RVRATGLMGLGVVKPRSVLADVMIECQVAPVVESASDVPAEDPARIIGIGDAAQVVIAIERGDVVARYGAPVAESRAVRDPAFDPREASLDARAIQEDAI